MIRILQLSNQKHIKQVMQDIKVDPYGMEIMIPKAEHFLLRINGISNITANILKQEMLSLGADVAVARGALTGRTKRTDCLVIGSLSQLGHLTHKLNKQPFGLDRLAQALSVTLKNYQRDEFMLDLGRFKLDLGRKTHLMGIVNLTTDSFSQDGLLSRHEAGGMRQEYILGHVERLVQEGADIVDIGGESTRPGAVKVSLKEELSRVLPVIKLLAKRIRVPLSIDTYKPEVARRALDSGAVIVNDISGLRHSKMAGFVSKYKAGLIIMHMKGTPRTMQKKPRYVSLMDEIISFLGEAIHRAEEAGISRDKIIIDPGIGFGKTLEHNLMILNSLAELKVLGRPLLVGPSRKSFLGRILNAGEQERIFGTVSACVLAASSGAKIVRVHDVKEVKQALRVFDSIQCH
jgi:dihydropteroate synthase